MERHVWLSIPNSNLSSTYVSRQECKESPEARGLKGAVGVGGAKNTSIQVLDALIPKDASCRNRSRKDLFKRSKV